MQQRITDAGTVLKFPEGAVHFCPSHWYIDVGVYGEPLIQVHEVDGYVFGVKRLRQINGAAVLISNSIRS